MRVLKWYVGPGLTVIGGGRVVLVAELGDGNLAVWTEEPEIPTRRTVMVFPTGVDVHGKHLGSAVLCGGTYVWHVYEVES